jgi:uncharacterized protein
VLSPLPSAAVRLTDGPWAEWQRANREVSIPHQLRWLEHDGTVDNLRRLAPGAASAFGPRRGLWFTDSDLYKAMEGMAWELGRAGADDGFEAGSEPGSGPGSGAASLRASFDMLVDVVRRAQEPDGYVNSWIQAGFDERWAHLEQSHELYCIGHLVQAGVAAARATGDRTLLDVAVRAADCVVSAFGAGSGSAGSGSAGSGGAALPAGAASPLDGHEEIEMALVELYRETGDDRYLRLASRFVDARGYGAIPTGSASSDYFQDGTPVRLQHDAVGHAVRAVYLLCGVVDVAVETDDTTLLAAAERQWATMTARKTYVTGALGSRFEGEAFGDDHELPADRGYGETCATIGNVMLSWRLLLATGHGKYADAIERSLHNLFAASTDVTRTAWFYNNPAQRRVALPASDPSVRPNRADAPGTRPPWFECACCPPNVLRTIASLDAYVATADLGDEHGDRGGEHDGGIQLHQYMPSTIDAGSFALTVRTDYPDDGVVRVTVDRAPDAPRTLALRIPAWAGDGWSLSVNGARVDAAVDDGYVRATRVWAEGDEVVLDLPMRVRFTVAHPAADGLRGTVAVERGPIVYALESPDQEPGVDLNEVAVDVSAPIRERLSDVAGVPVRMLVAQGRRAASSWEERGYAELGTPEWADDVELHLIPYALWANRGRSTMRVHIPIAR